jgi:hypothetical protein
MNVCLALFGTLEPAIPFSASCGQIRQFGSAPISVIAISCRGSRADLGGEPTVGLPALGFQSRRFLLEPPAWEQQQLIIGPVRHPNVAVRRGGNSHQAKEVREGHVALLSCHRRRSGSALTVSSRPHLPPTMRPSRRQVDPARWRLDHGPPQQTLGCSRACPTRRIDR